MKRFLVIGFVLFLVFAAAFAPASLVRTLLPADADVELLEPTGTLWHGSGALYLGGTPVGRVAWRFEPATLLQARFGYAVVFDGDDHHLNGHVAAGFPAATAMLSGRASAAFANQWLAPYDITISGDLEIREIALEVPYDVADTGSGQASGKVTWQGGPVRYRLSGRSYRGDLPPLAAELGPELEAVVVPAQDEHTPLLKARVMTNGFVKVGVTQRLTRILGNPWPGSHADHEVVLEVEEQLF